jgi:hypothetical protein
MTELLSRPDNAARTPAAGPPDRQLLVLGATAGLGAALRGLVLLAVVSGLVWWAEDRSGTDLLDVARATGQLWVVAHGAWLELPSGQLGLTPLGLTLLPLLLCRSAGRRLAERAGTRPPGRLALAVAAPYAVLAAVVAQASASATLRPVPLVAGVSAFLVAGVGTAVGAAAPGASRLPDRLRGVLRAGVAALAAVCAVGALLAGAALALDAGTATDLADAAEPGAVGGLGLLLLGAALVPNAVVWAASWLAGPGFAVGVGTSVTPFGTTLGPVPGLPLLAALPGGPPPALAVVALVVPVLAGVLAGRVLHRRQPHRSWRELAVDAVGAGAVAGLLLGVLAALSGGPLGAQHLAAVGPSAWQVGPALAVETALGAAVALAVARRRGGPA